MSKFIRSLSLRTALVVALLVTMSVFAAASGSRERGMMMHDVRSEYDFIVNMIPHHQEAVDSSLKIAGRTERPELRDFASGIATVQAAEIEMMESWLSQWYPLRSGRADYRPMMRSVAGFSNDRADRSFLEDMIMHHRMAVMMAQGLLSGNHSERPEVIDFARQVIRDQNSEIEQMEIWLQEWFGVSARGHMGMGH